ncbi:hypothetical protein NDU88_003441 [Pleurodeles waltl]|uniref:Uncharacterized protein n=1 Tax=Pleurodeles waltl TaxID=8319 RepID=A0AAV7V028_PLEWA|nr:hypothetical protein NDU88_003441 [Pleurodeles waltl]
MVARLPADKQTTMIETVRDMVRRNKVTVRDIQMCRGRRVLDCTGRGNSVQKNGQRRGGRGSQQRILGIVPAGGDGARLGSSPDA